MFDWGDGRYEVTGVQLERASLAANELAQVKANERVLDLGCGTGNALLEAARRGAFVTGVDPSPRLLEVTRERLVASQLSAELVVGDAESPGVSDGSFDAALAVFSIIFAPEPEAALTGLLRTLKPTARAVVATWSAEGAIHDSSMVLVKALLGEQESPSPWSSRDGLHALFASHPCTVEVQRRTLVFEAPSPVEWFEEQEAKHPFWRLARRTLAERGNDYPELRERCIAVLEAGNESASGFRCSSDYFLTRADLTS